MPQVDIVVVNWNAGNQLRECLDSISNYASDKSLGRVVVVDNDSSDNSLDRLEQNSLSLKIVRNETNRGFAAACNQGAKQGHSEYILFLNPDAQLKHESLEASLRYMSEPTHNNVGICGVQLLNDRGEVVKTCSRLPTPGILLAQMAGLAHLFPSLFLGQTMTEWDHGTTRVVDQVMGAYFLTRRSLFESLKGFDERFFVYYEEVDYSCRAKAAGWDTIYLADAQAYHKGGGTSSQVKAKRLFYSLRSRILYASKHFSPSATAMVMAATLILEPLSRLAWATVRATPSEAWHTVGGFMQLWRNMPNIIANIFGFLDKTE